ncbi:platelet-derived growth factor subunit A-like isoform X1 [Hoplias malabaricus]|uniref:platelet-derived growth factor subunit A-like isoform X1 n=1 Tax=Hoplias malabaricus TaxID=27720 RepID=UPI003461C31E
MRGALCCLFACCLCLIHTRTAAAEAESLPQELIERIYSSEISSISELQRLLQSQSLGAENEAVRETKWNYHKDGFNDSTNLKSSHSNPRRKRSIEEAVLAVCKTRTVVYEIPRSQVDSTAANFLVWPPCVEVTRCSGCCNTSNMRCHPTKKTHRTVKVAKLEYVRRRPKLRQVQVQLEDHLECVCMSKHHTESRIYSDIR